MVTTKNIKQFILESSFKLIAGLVLVFGIFILNELFIDGKDGAVLRISGLGLMALLLFLSKFKWAKHAYKYELSCIISNVSLRLSGLIKFSTLVLFAASICTSNTFEKVRSLVVTHVNTTVATFTKTVLSSYLAAKARLKSALRAIVQTLTPKLLLIPSARRA